MGVRQFLVQVVNTSDNKLISRRAYPYELGRVASLPERERAKPKKKSEKIGKERKYTKWLKGGRCGGVEGAGSELR